MVNAISETSQATQLLSNSTSSNSSMPIAGSDKQIKIKESEDNESKDPVAEGDRNHEKRRYNSSCCWITL